MYGFLVFLHVLVSLLLILVVLMQASRGGGLSGTFGSATSMAVFGGRGAGTFLSKVTVGLAIAFMSLALLISLISAPSGTGESIVRKKAAEQVPAPGAELPVPVSVPLETGE
ncbi:MAG: preprotein translocase subunit SecG [Fidelibacterota bacterium]